MKSIRLVRDCFISSISATRKKGIHPVGDRPGEIPERDARSLLNHPRFAVSAEGEEVESAGASAEGGAAGSKAGANAGAPATGGAGAPTLESDNAALAAHLDPLSSALRDAFWQQYGDAALNGFLATRFEVELKERNRGTIENMIESRLNLTKRD